MALFLVLMATTDGSLSITPRPRTWTRVLAVPRSTAMSRPGKRKAFSPPDQPLPALRWTAPAGGARSELGHPTSAPRTTQSPEVRPGVRPESGLGEDKPAAAGG